MATTTLSFDAVPSVLADIVQKLEVMEQKLDALNLLPEKETGDTWPQHQHGLMKTKNHYIQGR
ncbi:MAG: hypothetical protein J1E33_07530 [Alistipes sp.]|nr:hypothetical protein [Alistipes sp.]